MGYLVFLIFWYTQLSTEMYHLATLTVGRVGCFQVNMHLLQSTPDSILLPPPAGRPELGRARYNLHKEGEEGRLYGSPGLVVGPSEGGRAGPGRPTAAERERERESNIKAILEIERERERERERRGSFERERESSLSLGVERERGQNRTLLQEIHFPTVDNKKSGRIIIRNRPERRLF